MTSPEADPGVDLRLHDECVRLADRYVREVVITHRLCPWAKQSIAEARVKIQPILAKFSANEANVDAIRSIVLALEGVPSVFDLVLLPLPRFEESRLAMDALLRDVRAALRGMDCENTFALAAFHPDAAPNFQSPEAMIPYFRRTPLPLLQGIRTSVLEAISSRDATGTAFVEPSELLRKLAEPPRASLREDIAKANVATLERVGRERLDALFDELRSDAMTSLAVIDGDSTNRNSWSPKGSS